MTRSAMRAQLYHSPLTTTPPSSGQRAWAPGLAGLLLLGLGSAACLTGPPVYESPRRASMALALSEAGIPPTRPKVSAQAKPALAVMALVDARPAFHREALPTYLREEGGWTGEAPTRESAWRAPLARLATDDLVERLRRSGRFSRVDRVEVVGAVAPDALLLRARLRRLRGFQGYHVDRGTPPVLVVNLGEAYLDEVELGDPRTRKLLFLGQAGARIDRAEQLDPFALGRAAWAEAAGSLVERIAAEALIEVRAREVHLPGESRGDLTSLLEALPPAWIVDAAAPARAPPGWVGAGDCRAVALVDASRTFYQPQLGHYRPNLHFWICNPQVHLALRLTDEGPRFPAELVGSLEGAPVLFLGLGKTSWPGAPAEILRYLGADSLDGPVLRWPMRATETAGPEPSPEAAGEPAASEPGLRQTREPIIPPSGEASTDP